MPPSKGNTSLDKAQESNIKARTSLEKNEDGFASYKVISNDGVDKKSKSLEYIITVAAPTGHKIKAIVSSSFLNKKGKLVLQEMGVHGTTVIIAARNTLKPKEFYEHGCTTIRKCIETEYIIEGVL